MDRQTSSKHASDTKRQADITDTLRLLGLLGLIFAGITAVVFMLDPGSVKTWLRAAITVTSCISISCVFRWIHDL